MNFNLIHRLDPVGFNAGIVPLPGRADTTIGMAGPSSAGHGRLVFLLPAHHFYLLRAWVVCDALPPFFRDRRWFAGRRAEPGFILVDAITDDTQGGFRRVELFDRT